MPAGITSTGWPAVEHTCRTKLGLSFDDWQEQVGRVILAKRDDGKLAAMIDGVGLSVCRQVGKTYTVGALVFALCVNTPGLLVIWSAHHSRTHAETFLAMQDFAQRAKIAPHVEFVHTGSNTEEIKFHNGSRILFGARERGFGRGIPGVDVLIFDEGQILSDRALSNMLATLNTSSLGLQLYIGTPPKPEDMSEAFTRMRDQALKGDLTDGAWIELGAEDGCDSDDRKQWKIANPSYPKRTPVESMLRLRRKLTDADWRREGLGLWPEFDATEQVIAGGDWAKLVVDDAPEGDPDYFSLTMSPERIAFIGVGFRVGGDQAFLDLAEGGRMDDSRKVIDWFVERRKTNRRLTVAIDSRDPAAAFVNELRSHRIKVNVMTQSDSGRACVGLLDAVGGGLISHVDQPIIREGLAVAKKLAIGKAGQWEWDPRDESPGVAALRAITLVRFGLSLKRKKAGPQRITVLS